MPPYRRPYGIAEPDLTRQARALAAWVIDHFEERHGLLDPGVIVRLAQSMTDDELAAVARSVGIDPTPKVIAAARGRITQAAYAR